MDPLCLPARLRIQLHNIYRLYSPEIIGNKHTHTSLRAQQDRKSLWDEREREGKEPGWGQTEQIYQVKLPSGIDRCFPPFFRRCWSIRVAIYAEKTPDRPRRGGSTPKIHGIPTGRNDPSKSRRETKEKGKTLRRMFASRCWCNLHFSPAPCGKSCPTLY